MARTVAQVRRGQAFRLPAVVRGAYQAANMGYSAYKAYNRYKSGNRTATRTTAKVAPAPLTYQNDAAVTYRRKAAPKRVKVKARRFAKRALSNNLRELSKQTFFFETLTQPPWSNNSLNLNVGLSIGTGLDAGINVNTPNSDIYSIMRTLSNEATVPNGYKIYIDSMRLTCTLRVTGQPCFVDVYDYVCTRDVESSVSTAYVTGFQNNMVLPAVTPTTSINVTQNTAGANPFLQSHFGKFFKIVKVTRYNFSNGYVTFERRYNRNLSITSDRILQTAANAGIPSLKGITQGFLLIFRRDVIPSPESTQVFLSTTRTYNVKYLSQNQGTIQQLIGP